MKHRLRSLTVAVSSGVFLALLPAVAAAAAEEEHGAEGIAALGFSLPGLIAQLINFLVLLVILRLFLWGPIVKLLDERRQRIEEGLRSSEEAAAAAASSQEESRRIIDEARAEARDTIARSQETAQRLRDELETQARTDAEAIVSRARDEIDREREQAVQQLRAEFASLTMFAAERVIGQSLDQEAHQRLIDEVLVESDFGASQSNN